MTLRLQNFSFAASLRAMTGVLLCLAVVGGDARAQGLRNLPNLQSVTIVERTTVAFTNHYTLGGGAAFSGLTTQGSFDFFSGAGDEAYDFCLSDADGTLNANGAYLSILARFSPNDAGGNIDSVRLNFSGGVEEFASSVVGYAPSAGATAGEIAAQGFGANALGTTDGISTAIARAGTGRLTVGFASSAAAGAPEPATLALLGGGALIPLVGMVRSRRRRGRRGA